MRFGFYLIEKKRFLIDKIFDLVGRSGEKSVSHKNSGKRLLDINFAKIWELSKTMLTITTNLTYEKYKFFGRVTRKKTR